MNPSRSSCLNSPIIPKSGEERIQCQYQGHVIIRTEIKIKEYLYMQASRQMYEEDFRGVDLHGRSHIPEVD